MAKPQAVQLLITGQVQGVGFRPFIYRLAHQHQLHGWVKNLAGQVAIRLQGQPAQLVAFQQQLISHAPPLAKPQIQSCQPCTFEPQLNEFSILPSDSTATAKIHVPVDYFTCDDCLSELRDPTDRRYGYPFINCTQCGPRYTLIKKLPYDRPHTSMAAFQLCADCDKEYHDPLDRRFHAQPIACPVCGPQLSFHLGTEVLHDTPTQSICLAACVTALQAGKIIAVKGIGGYHLLCLATDDAAIQRLRANKPRPDKPLAVLISETDLSQFHLSVDELSVLKNPARSILLVTKPEQLPLSDLIAPQLNEIGIMLPYSPLHHLLLDACQTPLVATSANLSGEPVLTDNDTVEQRLSHVADGFLHHNRPIVRPADDSLLRWIAGQARPLRLGRGSAPLELDVPWQFPQPVLAVGAHLKNTVALGWEQRVVISPHIGDLAAPRSVDVFAQVIADLQQLYAVQAAQVVCDAHPDYASSRWARQSGLPVHTIWHHHAHASAVAGEFVSDKPWLVFTWDGVGLGCDGQLWGGEALYGQTGHWQRLAHLRPFKLPGGDKAGREPWRSAAALCWTANYPVPPTLLPAQQATDLLQQAWQRGLNSPVSTAAGRLFDAAAALAGLCRTASYEGQAAMALEACCGSNADFLTLPLTQTVAGGWAVDWQPLLPMLTNSNLSMVDKASLFHNSLAHAILAQALTIQVQYPIGQIGLSGGVFQNRYLSEQVIALLENAGFQVFLPAKLPCNDASISFGQLVDYCGQIMQ